MSFNFPLSPGDVRPQQGSEVRDAVTLSLCCGIACLLSGEHRLTRRVLEEGLFFCLQHSGH